MNKNEHFWENLLENVLHILQQISAFIASFLNRFLSLFFGSGNERIIRAYTPKVTAINERESAMQALSDTELKECTHGFVNDYMRGKHWTICLSMRLLLHVNQAVEI